MIQWRHSLNSSIVLGQDFGREERKLLPYVKARHKERYCPANAPQGNVFMIAIWCGLECSLGIISGSLATLRPLLRKALRGLDDGSPASSQPEPVEKTTTVWPGMFNKRRIRMEHRGISLLNDPTDIDLTQASTASKRRSDEIQVQELYI